MDVKTLAKKAALPLLGILVVLGIALAPSIYFYKKYQEAQKAATNPTESAQKEAEKLIAAVSKIMELPEGEVPTVATVSDEDKLKENQFLARAKNGDKILIYKDQVKKAIIYRPSTGKIVDVGAVSINEQQGQVAGAETDQTGSVPEQNKEGETKEPPKEEPKKEEILLKIALFNGTKTTGLTKTVEEKLKTNGIKFEIPDRDNASKDNYNKTLVVGITSGNEDVIKQISELLGADVVALPEGEKKPEANILIIAGQNLVK